jgi:hypothetical protein
MTKTQEAQIKDLAAELSTLERQLDTLSQKCKHTENALISRTSQLDSLSVAKQELSYQLQAIEKENLFGYANGVEISENLQVPSKWVLGTLAALTLRIDQRQSSMEALKIIHDRLLSDLEPAVNADKEWVRGLLINARSHLQEALHQDRLLTSDSVHQCALLRSSCQEMFKLRALDKRLRDCFRQWRYISVQAREKLIRLTTIQSQFSFNKHSRMRSVIIHSWFVKTCRARQLRKENVYSLALTARKRRQQIRHVFAQWMKLTQAAVAASSKRRYRLRCIFNTLSRNWLRRSFVQWRCHAVTTRVLTVMINAQQILSAQALAALRLRNWTFSVFNRWRRLTLSRYLLATAHSAVRRQQKRLEIREAFTMWQRRFRHRNTLKRLVQRFALRVGQQKLRSNWFFWARQLMVIKPICLTRSFGLVLLKNWRAKVNSEYLWAWRRWSDFSKRRAISALQNSAVSSSRSMQSHRCLQRLFSSWRNETGRASSRRQHQRKLMNSCVRKLLGHATATIQKCWFIWKACAQISSARLIDCARIANTQRDRVGSMGRLVKRVNNRRLQTTFLTVWHKVTFKQALKRRCLIRLLIRFKGKILRDYWRVWTEYIKNQVLYLAQAVEAQKISTHRMRDMSFRLFFAWRSLTCQTRADRVVKYAHILQGVRRLYKNLLLQTWKQWTLVTSNCLHRESLLHVHEEHEISCKNDKKKFDREIKKMRQQGWSSATSAIMARSRLKLLRQFFLSWSQKSFMQIRRTKLVSRLLNISIKSLLRTTWHVWCCRSRHLAEVQVYMDRRKAGALLVQCFQRHKKTFSQSRSVFVQWKFRVHMLTSFYRRRVKGEISLFFRSWLENARSRVTQRCFLLKHIKSLEKQQIIQLRNSWVNIVRVGLNRAVRAANTALCKSRYGRLSTLFHLLRIASQVRRKRQAWQTWCQWVRCCNEMQVHCSNTISRRQLTVLASKFCFWKSATSARQGKYRMVERLKSGFFRLQLRMAWKKWIHHAHDFGKQQHYSNNLAIAAKLAVKSTLLRCFRDWSNGFFYRNQLRLHLQNIIFRCRRRAWHNWKQQVHRHRVDTLVHALTNLREENTRQLQSQTRLAETKMKTRALNSVAQVLNVSVLRTCWNKWGEYSRYLRAQEARKQMRILYGLAVIMYRRPFINAWRRWVLEVQHQILDEAKQFALQKLQDLELKESSLSTTLTLNRWRQLVALRAANKHRDSRRTSVSSWNSQSTTNSDIENDIFNGQEGTMMKAIHKLSKIKFKHSFLASWRLWMLEVHCQMQIEAKQLSIKLKALEVNNIDMAEMLSEMTSKLEAKRKAEDDQAYVLSTTEKSREFEEIDESMEALRVRERRARISLQQEYSKDIAMEKLRRGGFMLLILSRHRCFVSAVGAWRAWVRRVVACRLLDSERVLCLKRCISRIERRPLWHSWRSWAQAADNARMKNLSQQYQDQRKVLRSKAVLSCCAQKHRKASARLWNKWKELVDHLRLKEFAQKSDICTREQANLFSAKQALECQYQDEIHRLNKRHLTRTLLSSLKRSFDNFLRFGWRVWTDRVAGKTLYRNQFLRAVLRHSAQLSLKFIWRSWSLSVSDARRTDLVREYSVRRSLQQQYNEELMIVTNLHRIRLLIFCLKRRCFVSAVGAWRAWVRRVVACRLLDSERVLCLKRCISRIERRPLWHSWRSWTEWRYQHRNTLISKYIHKYTRQIKANRAHGETVATTAAMTFTHFDVIKLRPQQTAEITEKAKQEAKTEKKAIQETAVKACQDAIEIVVAAVNQEHRDQKALEESPQKAVIAASWHAKTTDSVQDQIDGLRYKAVHSWCIHKHREACARLWNRWKEAVAYHQQRALLLMLQDQGSKIQEQHTQLLRREEIEQSKQSEEELMRIEGQKLHARRVLTRMSCLDLWRSWRPWARGLEQFSLCDVTLRLRDFAKSKLLKELTCYKLHVGLRRSQYNKKSRIKSLGIRAFFGWRVVALQGRLQAAVSVLASEHSENRRMERRLANESRESRSVTESLRVRMSDLEASLAAAKLREAQYAFTFLAETARLRISLSQRDSYMQQLQAKNIRRAEFFHRNMVLFAAFRQLNNFAVLNRNKRRNLAQLIEKRSLQIKTKTITRWRLETKEGHVERLEACLQAAKQDTENHMAKIAQLERTEAELQIQKQDLAAQVQNQNAELETFQKRGLVSVMIQTSTEGMSHKHTQTTSLSNDRLFAGMPDPLPQDSQTNQSAKFESNLLHGRVASSLIKDLHLAIAMDLSQVEDSDGDETSPGARVPNLTFPMHTSINQEVINSNSSALALESKVSTQAQGYFRHHDKMNRQPHSSSVGSWAVEEERWPTVEDFFNWDDDSRKP